MADDTRLNANTSTGDLIVTDSLGGVPERKVQAVKIMIGTDGVDDGLVDGSNQLPVTGSFVAIHDVTEDAASVANPIGPQIMARRRDSLVSEVSGDGDHLALNATPKAELYVKHVDSIPVTGTVTLSGAVDTELPAAAALGDSVANPTAPAVGAFLMGYDEASANWERCTTDGNGILAARVLQGVPANLQAQVQGPDASDAAITGNPLLSGARASTAIPANMSADGDAVALWASRRGALKSHLVDDDGDSVTDSVNNAVRANIVAGTVTLPAGASTSANQTTEITALQIIDDLPHAMNDAFNKAAAIGGQLDDTSTTAATENNVAPVRITAQRALHTNLRNVSGTEVGTAAAPIRTDPTGTTTQPVSGTVAVSGTVTTQDTSSLVDNAGFTDGTSRVLPIGMIFDETAGTALTENDVAAARIDSKRAQILTIEDATTRGQRVAVSAGGALEVHGEVAHDIAVSGNPVLVGYEARTTNGTPVSNGDASRGLSDTLGKQVILQGAVHDLWTSGRVTLTDTTAADVIGAGGAGVRIVVTKIAFTNASGAVPTKVEIRDGTTVKLQLSAEVFGGISMPAESPFFIGTANTAVSARCVTTGADVDVFISGYVINN